MTDQPAGLASAATVESAAGEGALVRTILDNVADALITFDEAGRIIAYNPAAERLFGYRATEVIGALLAMLFAEAYAGEPVLGMVRPQVANAPDRRGGGDRNAGFRRERDCRRRDGTIFPAELHIGAMPLSTGLWYIASVRDIGDQRAAEATLARQADALREQSELLDLAHDAIVVCDLLGIVESWNLRAAALYGWTREEARDRPIHELLQSSFPVSLAAALDELLQSDSWAGPLDQVRRDGTGVRVAARWTLRRGPQRQPTGIMMINRELPPAG